MNNEFISGEGNSATSGSHIGNKVINHQILISSYTDLRTLKLSTRTYNTLHRAGIKTLLQLQSLSKREVQGIRNIGMKTLEEIEACVGPLPEVPVEYSLLALGLSIETCNKLRRAGIRNETELRSILREITRAEIQEMLNTSHKALEEIEACVGPLPEVPEEGSLLALGLSIETCNKLRRAGIRNETELRSISQAPENKLLEIRNIGLEALADIEKDIGPLAKEPYMFIPPLIEPSFLTQIKDQGFPLDEIDVQLLRLSDRAYSLLQNANIRTIEQLTTCSKRDLLDITDFNMAIIDELIDRLNQFLNKRFNMIGAETIPISLAEAIRRLLSVLKTERQQEIIRLRYGIDDGIERTLEEVGQHWGITRERVRQIQQEALRRLNHPSRIHLRGAVTRPLKMIFQQAGGILSEEQIYETISRLTVVGDINPVGATRFSLQLSPIFIEIDYKIWAVGKCEFELYSNVLLRAYKQLEINLARMRLNDLINEVYDLYLSTDNSSQLQISPKFIEACIRASDQFEVSRNGWCSLSKWKRSYIDESVEILRNAGTPLHYKKILYGVNNLLPPDQQINERSLLGTLQRSKDIFVNVDYGTYSLVERDL